MARCHWVGFHNPRIASHRGERTMASGGEDVLSAMGRLKVLVVGDIILDGYIWGMVERVSPEAPVQVLEWRSESSGLGGAANVAHNVRCMGCHTYLAGVIGNDQKGKELTSLLREADIDASGVLEDPDKPTINKIRMIAQQQQILRIDREQRTPLRPALERQLERFLKKTVPKVDGVICSDYGKGTLTAGLLTTLSTITREHSKPVIADPKGSDHLKYKGIDILTPNVQELELMDGGLIASEESLRKAARRLIRSAGLKALVVTRGKDGMSVFQRRGHGFHIPAQAREVFDVSGAGDTAIAFLAMGLFAQMDLKAAANIANKAAGIVVGKVGALPASPAELLQELNESPSHTSQKIVRLPELKRTLSQARSQQRRIVFTNGCFDLLHIGHIRYLQLAKRLGDVLVVGLNSDSSVRKIKGPERPVIHEEERAHIVAALSDVDYVIIFPETTPRRLIAELAPDILVKGGDYTPETVVGRDIVERYGGKVEIVPYVGSVSTTEIMQRIAERFN